MVDLAQTIDHLVKAKKLRRGDGILTSQSAARWGLIELSGRLTEICAGASPAGLTVALGLVRDAQRLGEPAAWVTSLASIFFPPDAAEGGVLLDALPVVRVPWPALLRAADMLARSGAFGLIAVDLSSERRARLGQMRRHAPALSRLLGLCKKHNTAVVFLTRRDPFKSSLGSLVSLRGDARRLRVDTDKYEVSVRVQKDKRRAPGWGHVETCRGPAGLC